MAVASNDYRFPKIVTPGGIPRIVQYPEAASQSFKIGQPVYLNSGALTMVANGAVDTASVLPIGFAAADASGTTSALCAVFVPDANSEIIIQVSSAGTIETANTTAVRGTNYAMYHDSTTGITTLNSAVTNKDVFQLIDYVYDVTGAVTTWCVARPVAAGWGSLAGA